MPRPKKARARSHANAAKAQAANAARRLRLGDTQQPNKNTISDECEEVAERKRARESVECEEAMMKMDSCLLCGHFPAVVYDPDGKAIKREAHQQEYSYQELYSNLCHLLSVRKLNENSKLIKTWDFVNSDPFPFCEQCESRMVSLSELYTKLRQLEEIVRAEMVKAEEIYSKEGLYMKHDPRYITFRKTLLQGKFTVANKESCGGNYGEVKTTEEDEEEATGQRQRHYYQTRQSMRQRESCFEERVDTTAGGVHAIKWNIIEDEMKVVIEQEKQRVEFESSDSNPDPLALDSRRPGTSAMASLPTKTSPNVKERSEDIRSKVAKSKRNWKRNASKIRMKSRLLRKNQVKNLLLIKKGRVCDICEMPLNEMGTQALRRHRLTHMNEEDEQHFLTTTAIRNKAQLLKDIAYSRKKKMEISKKMEVRGQKSAAKATSSKKAYIKVDHSTGNVTYETGIGNRFTSKRLILHFTKLSEDKLNEIYTYKCDSCSELISQKTKDSWKQKGTFRAHYVSFHSDRFKCRLCPEEDSFRNSVDFQNHLKSVHNLKNKQDMKNAINWKSSVKLVRTCTVCGMPNDKMNQLEFRRHQLTHMSDDDKKEMLLSAAEDSRRRGVINLQTDEISCRVREQNTELCETCGKYYARGNTIAQHRRTHENKKELCPICGSTFSTIYTLDKHVKRFHPDGKVDEGSIKYSCRFPECGWSVFKSSSDLSLKEHVELEHGNSEVKGVVCKVCGKVFTDSWTLKQHSVVHSATRSFECHLCSKTFQLKPTLTMHLAAVHRQGEGMGVFKCEAEGCAEVFPCKSYRTSHMRRCHQIFQRKINKLGIGKI